MRTLLQLGTAIAFGVLAFSSSALDPTLTVGADACIDCHTPAHDVWQETTHFKTYDELSASDEANEIAEALEIDDIEDPEGLCVGCHFTLVGDTREDAEPIAGISCESCHGAAANWVDVHGEYLSGDAASESAAQKATRIAASQKAGQIRPAQINEIASNCLTCHTVPNEKLVNVGGHPAGSDFELVSWSQGEVRHNLFWSNGETNKEITPERKRLLFVVGHATDLEFSLRALAKSTEAGTFRSAMADRVKNAMAEVKNINAKINSSELASVISAAGSIDPAATPDAGKISAAADKIQSAVAAFTKANDGSKLAALDALVPQGDGHYSEKY
ncbi:MAG: multiheme c-type cytochrome [Halioglobus sp.]